MKYRKKPVIIEAILWDETKETCLLLQGMGMSVVACSTHARENYVRNLKIETLEGSLNASKGDYIIKGIKGEFYPCKPDIFEATYEKAE